jgi:hypothetical protein
MRAIKCGSMETTAVSTKSGPKDQALVAMIKSLFTRTHSPPGGLYLYKQYPSLIPACALCSRL